MGMGTRSIEYYSLSNISSTALPVITLPTQLYIQMVVNALVLKLPRTKGRGLAGLGRTLECNHFCSTTHDYIYQAFSLSLQHLGVSCCVSKLYVYYLGVMFQYCNN